MKEKNSPGVSAPEMTWKPPYQSAPIRPSAPITSISGSASWSVRWSFRARRISRSLTSSKRCCSSASRPKALTILVPVNDSCSTTFSSAIFCCERLLIL